MRELRYAALLHDFGKVGVREKVLTKASKLYEEQLQDSSSVSCWRVPSIGLSALRPGCKTRSAIGTICNNASHNCIRNYKKLAAFDTMQRMVVAADQPIIIATGDYSALVNIRHWEFVDSFGRRDSV